MTRPSSTRTLRRLAAAGTLALAALAAAAVPASAHVTVAADDTSKGAPDAVLGFRVPNESEDATTVKVEITLPQKTPIASVKPSAPPGWTFTTTPVTFAEPIETDDGTISEGVGSVTFTAGEGAGIPVGGFATFQLLVGPLPEAADSLSFPTVQTYSNGDVDRWVDPVVEGQDEPENPAPTLGLTTAGAAGGPAADAGTTPVDTSQLATREDVATGRTLGLVGAVLGALGALLGAIGAVRAGRRAAPAARTPRTAEREPAGAGTED